jgi:tetratricopeptide (TPR) repeat protein
LILLSLTAAVIGPIIYMGMNELNAAQSARSETNYLVAEKLFESAANKLFWQADLWEQAGQMAYKNGDQNNSIRLLEIARQKGSLSPDGWNTLGIDFWVKGDQPGAILIWKSALQSYPSYAPIYDQLITAAILQENFVSEQDLLTKRLALGDDAIAHYRLGLLLTLSDQRRAEQEFITAASMDPELKPVTMTLLSALDSALGETNGSRQFVIIGRGLGLVDEWGLASRSFEKAINVNNGNAEAWAWYGESRQHQGLDGGVELDKAFTLDPRDTVVLGLRGLYWKRQGLYAKALAEYQQAAEIEPENPAWQTSIGESSALNGNLVLALSAYQKATSLAPDDVTYWRLLAMFCSDYGVQVLDIGLPAAQKAVQIAPNDPQALDALGWSYLNAGYLFNAEQDLTRAIKIEPDFALAHVHLAETYLQKGDRDSALIELYNARDLDPNGSSGQLVTQLLSRYFP